MSVTFYLDDQKLNDDLRYVIPHCPHQNDVHSLVIKINDKASVKLIFTNNVLEVKQLRKDKDSK